MKTLNKKLIVWVAAAVLALAVILVAFSAFDGEENVTDPVATEPAVRITPYTLPKATLIPGTATVPEADPTPTIPLPDDDNPDPSSGSDIVLEIVQPTTDSDVQAP